MTSKHTLFFVVFACGLMAPAAHAKSFSGPRGGSGMISVSRIGNTGTASFSGTTASGHTASRSASAVVHPVTGTVTGSGNVTGPADGTHGGSVVVGNGSATVTGNDGQSRTWSQPQ